MKKISYLCDRCVQDAAACITCDKGNRFIEVNIGKGVSYDRFYDPKAYREARNKACNIRLIPDIKNVIFNAPATIVVWADGTKTVVKCQDGDVYDAENGFAMAIAKKALGNKGNFNEVFKKWLPEEDVEPIYPNLPDAFTLKSIDSKSFIEAIRNFGKAISGDKEDT